MKLNEMFGSAVWVGAPKKKIAFPILRAKFAVSGIKRATLKVIGLGYFDCRINGSLITDDRFLPLSTDYEPRLNHPTDECLTGHRIYVPEYDVTSLLSEGENLLSIHFGGGWYTYGGWGGIGPEAYGSPKAIYRLTVETDDGTVEFVSSEADKIGESFVKKYVLTNFEEQDYEGFDDKAFELDFDDSAWQNAELAEPLETEYLTTDCPADRVAEVIVPTVSNVGEGEISYDNGKNLSGWPILRLKAKKGEKVEVIFAEERTEDGKPHPSFTANQHFSVISDGSERLVMPRFMWFAFRYFTVKGDAEVVRVEYTHTDVSVTGKFDCDNETLNWIYEAYLNTQLCNMHGGIPSDCPHHERRGYTGDGQLIAHAAMDVLDAQSFYRKWIDDISDCQDVYSGHVQYTAPYLRSGGGPGGWGCAIIEVPYIYYRHYGDAEPLERLYPQMLRYFDYLESHSKDNLVVSDKKNEWCLGDWCPPIQVILPAPFVNNYFYIKSLYRMKEIASLVGRECDLPLFDERIEARKAAIMAAYYNTWDGNFIGCMQGANAFMVDIGLGDERTYKQLVKYYTELGRYDTGIFGTDVVTRVLFEHGDGELAVKLLTSSDKISFEGMRRVGATTLWENWPYATWDRSRNHPMFGAVTAYLFDCLLGIKQVDGGVAYRELVIEPVLVEKLSRASGSRVLPAGEISVAYEKKDGGVEFVIVIPEGVTAKFKLGELECPLEVGENRFRV